MLRHYIFPLLMVLALTACTRQGGLTEDPEQQQEELARQQAVSEFSEWDMYARAVLRMKGEVYHVGIRWDRQANRHFKMFLDAPFGQGVLRIDGLGAQGYRLGLPDGRQFENNSAEALLDEVVGWTLPISGLDYWVRGLPDPRSKHRVQLDSAGRTRSIAQDGWEISYQDYFDDLTPPLPRRFSLANDQLTLKLAIERWQQAPTDSSDAELFPSFD